MADYLARVELHAATDEDYETLHTQMQHRGFLRVIRGNNQIVYHLPTGTYVMRNTNVTLEDALNPAGAATQATGRASSIIVVAWTHAMWRGLAAA